MKCESRISAQGAGRDMQNVGRDLALYVVHVAGWRNQLPNVP